MKTVFVDGPRELVFVSYLDKLLPRDKVPKGLEIGHTVKVGDGEVELPDFIADQMIEQGFAREKK